MRGLNGRNSLFKVHNRSKDYTRTNYFNHLVILNRKINLPSLVDSPVERRICTGTHAAYGNRKNNKTIISRIFSINFCGFTMNLIFYNAIKIEVWC